MSGRPLRFGFCVPLFANPGAAYFRTPGLQRLDPAAAIDHYLRAADRTASVPERNYLLGRAARLGHIRAT